MKKFLSSFLILFTATLAFAETDPWAEYHEQEYKVDHQDGMVVVPENEDMADLTLFLNERKTQIEEAWMNDETFIYEDEFGIIEVEKSINDGPFISHEQENTYTEISRSRTLYDLIHKVVDFTPFTTEANAGLTVGAIYRIPFGPNSKRPRLKIYVQRD